MKKLFLGFVALSMTALTFATPVPATWNEAYWPTAKTEARLTKSPVPGKEANERLVKRDVDSVLKNNDGKVPYYVSSDNDPYKFVAPRADR